MNGFNVELDLQGAAELSRLWDTAPDITREELLSAVTEIDLMIEAEVKENTPVGVGGGGGLRGSIFSQEESLANNVLGVVGTSQPYAIAVELGTEPHFPPVEPLKDWVRQKLDVEASEVDHVAFLVARKIASKGTEGKFMFSNAMKEKRAEAVQRFDHAVQRVRDRLAGGR
tara:strand:+ start:92961 stop:93473 length:513 start_codon:yes stop_codon:yes gene_type:complete